MKLRTAAPFLLLTLILAGCGAAPVAEIPSSAASGEQKKLARNTASALPELITVEAKFERETNPGNIEDDDGSTVVWLMANIPWSKFSVPINDQLYLGGASSHAFIAPTLNGCQLSAYSFDYLGQGNQTINFDGRDAKGKRECRNFLEAIARNGLHMEFTDVPLRNKGNIIKKVIVNITFGT